MNRPTEVIMYRTPGEYALWHSGLVFPIIVGAVLSIVAVLSVFKMMDIIEEQTGWYVTWDKSIIAIVVAIATMAGTVAYMT